ncbi:hypothetical protein F4821DRAFT_282014 [Hypoxylon rubiginosum]|uniref:Uncharacterized protein n=1 Tax=Hypoxylon rubiginosum TaxID=110542 RepID=A0ACC0CP86_9PEZI|nr:hypothetical protein F4821DRAFT_282014 [Hypoxylon rubiginosum]
MRAESARQDHFMKIVDGHFTIGVRQTTSLLPSLNKDNCLALYVATVLTCYCSFAQAPGPRQLLVIDDGYAVPWVGLLRGVRFVVESIGVVSIFSGFLAPSAPPSSTPEEPSTLDGFQVEFVSWEEHLLEVPTLVATASTAITRDIYRSTFGCLEWYFGGT